MQCPYCSVNNTHVLETRISDNGFSIRRRRKCQYCGKRFTTYEHPDISLPVVIKRNGMREVFESQKIYDSMLLALRKRPVGVEKIDNAIYKIQENVLNLGLREIASTKLGEYVMQELMKIDIVGYIRYASVYQDFEDENEFRSAIDKIASNVENKKFAKY